MHIYNCLAAAPSTTHMPPAYAAPKRESWQKWQKKANIKLNPHFKFNYNFKIFCFNFKME